MGDSGVTVIGHENIKRQLKTANDLPPTALFIGPDGIGKTTFARWLLRDIHHVDIDDFIAEKTTIAQLRGYVASIGRQPFASAFRVGLINFDSVTTQAADTLLKLLEEPPAHVKLILLTSIGRVPATIMSRCRRYYFNALEEHEVVQVLKKLGTVESIAEWAAARANGSVMEAQQLAFNEGRYQDAETMVELLLEGHRLAYLNKLKGADDLTVAMIYRVLIERGNTKHVRLLEANILSKTKLLLLGLSQ